ncbi:hypothetical protein [Lysobacter sp. yr284]|uniref:hypothetical protein n=1 Tax=Lysobacter sp. yr284 TaxID=1761791 RepID=UPI0011134314|nr:hypothetical protein [Lysobacter sp. yr284]
MSAKLPRNKIAHYTKDQLILLKWVIAHEIGHIEKGHHPSSYRTAHSGFLVYEVEQQRSELEADEYSISVMGALDKSEAENYALLLTIVNNLIRKNLCPTTYPEPCEAIAQGAGILFNSSNFDPIVIDGGTRHPDFIARMLRLLYLAGRGTKVNSINYLAMRAIERLKIKSANGLVVVDASSSSKSALGE